MQGKKTTMSEIINNLIDPSSVAIIDNSCNGKCSECGECCTPFLSMCQKELDIIQKYVIKNDISPQKQLLVMENKLTCPYYNGKKCLIYKVRPLICREFYCYKKPTIEMAIKFKEKNIFQLIFGK